MSITTIKADEYPDKSSVPNIVLILVDDMGYSDIGCYGGEVQTPNIDGLAERGLRFTEFHNMARCCPTRATLLTGLYPHQVGLTINGKSLSRDGATLAELLGPHGYQTAAVGKWHLSETPNLGEPHLRWVNHQMEHQPFAPLDSYPVNRGFDRFYGIIWGVVNFFDPFSLVEGTEPVREVPEDYYITNAITEKAVEYLDDFGRGENADKPFFLYLAHCAPHWPLHALPEDIAKYKDTYTAGWDELRKTRYARMVDLGLIDPATTRLVPLTDDRSWDALTAEQKAFESHAMAVHAAMIDRVDQGIGIVLEKLQSMGQLDNTLILFLSDNGASPERPVKAGYDRPSQTRDGRRILYKDEFDRAGPETTYGGIGPSWASAANTPFRYWKKESFEGGCCTPLIAHWPAGLKTQPGAITDQVGHVIDVLPTCLEVAGLERPSELNGHKLLPLEGKSLIPILDGKERQPHDVLYWEHVGGRAVRAGDWKLVALPKRPWELYNLGNDRNETTNLADRHPERVADLEKQWNAWADRVGLEKPGPKKRKQ